ncbi:hypothetical protein IFR05_003401 [Cadophora sp. M221]|nr:hypothetical protein IFR05_003401 [Cadophora sp. M221]
MGQLQDVIADPSMGYTSNANFNQAQALAPNHSARHQYLHTTNTAAIQAQAQTTNHAIQSRNQYPVNMNTPQAQSWPPGADFSSIGSANPPVGDLGAGGGLLRGQADSTYVVPVQHQHSPNPNTAQGQSDIYGEHYLPYRPHNASAGNCSNPMGGTLQAGKRNDGSHEAQAQGQTFSNGLPSTYSQVSSQTIMGPSRGGYHNPSLDNQHGMMGSDYLAMRSLNSVALSSAGTLGPGQPPRFSSSRSDGSSQRNSAQSAGDRSMVKPSNLQEVSYQTTKHLASKERMAVETARAAPGTTRINKPNNVPYQSQSIGLTTRLQTNIPPLPTGFGASDGTGAIEPDVQRLFAGGDLTESENSTRSESPQHSIAVKNTTRGR